MNSLYQYQRDIAISVLDSILNKRGLTFCVEIARQGGKNELSAQLELFLLTVFMAEPLNIIKCSPTFKPQTVISMNRLKDRLNDVGFEGIWSSEMGYAIRLGRSKAIFLSADKSASVVGHTAHLLPEIDEAQDVDKEKFTKEFKPMGASTNVTTVLYGTAWDDSTLLEETKQACYELEKQDGIRRCFRYDWQAVADYNEAYKAYVEGERQRLGEEHPLFQSQYLLQPVRGGGGFFSSQQRAQLQGAHTRRRASEKGKIYVAGVDLAGEAEEEEGYAFREVKKRRDATVVTIGELDLAVVDDVNKQPGIKIVEHYRWVGEKHTQLYRSLIDILKNTWRCRRVVVDATGAGQPVSAFLKQSLGSVVVPFVFTQQSKSALGFNLQSAVNSGRLKMYAADGSAEYAEFWFEIEKAVSHYRASRTMNFYVDPSRGYDDFLMSLALAAEAARGWQPRTGRGTLV